VELHNVFVSLEFSFIPHDIKVYTNFTSFVKRVYNYFLSFTNKKSSPSLLIERGELIVVDSRIG